MTTLSLTPQQLDQQKLTDEKLEFEKKLNAAQRLKADCENDIAYCNAELCRIKMKLNGNKEEK